MNDAPAPEVLLHHERLIATTLREPVERVVLRRRITTEVRQVQVTVRREELEIVRVPVAPGSQAVPVTRDAAPLVVTLSEEVPVVELRTRAYEQVTVHVDAVHGEQVVTADVGREQAEVVTDPPNGRL